MPFTDWYWFRQYELNGVLDGAAIATFSLFTAYLTARAWSIDGQAASQALARRWLQRSHDTRTSGNGVGNAVGILGVRDLARNQRYLGRASQGLGS